MNPAILLNILKGVGNIAPGIINTISSIVKDKKGTDTDENPESLLIPPIGSAASSIATGMNISSKRLMNVCGTGMMMYVAVQDYIANGLGWQGVALFALGAVYSAGMAWITKQSEQ